jgi:ABC-type Mn2+/Zn2+ transport system permease subunit
MGEFMQSWTFIVLMIVILVALIGLFLYLRNQGDED